MDLKLLLQLPLLLLSIVLFVQCNKIPNISNNIPNHLIMGNISTKQSTGCRYEYSFTQIGQVANLDSPNYPNSYPANVNCQYFISSPIGTRIQLNCNDFNVEQSTNCQYDIFYYSLSGTQTFTDQEFSCGKGTFSKTSKSNKIAIGFRSDDSNPQSTVPFRYRCQLKVVADPTPVCECGLKGEMTRIVGGSQSKVGAWPWRCTLYSEQKGVFCGCTVISKNYVLTAAHCTAAVKGQKFWVNAGDYDLSSTSDSMNQIRVVDRVVQNQQYSTANQDSDISLLHLEKPLEFGKAVQPTCLPWKFRSTDFTNAIVTASGFGTQGFGGAQSNVMREVDLSVISQTECTKYYATKLTNNMMCTYTPGKDTCQGDSGGSIDFKDTNTGRFYSLGVVSWGNGCAAVNHPGVYTKLVNYLDWIQTNSPEEVYCKA